MSIGSASGRAAGYSDPASRLVPIMPSDDDDLVHGPTRGVYVGVAGAFRVTDAAGGVTDITSAGSQYHPIRVRRIHASGTSASGIIALY